MKSLKIPKGNQNPYIEEEKTTTMIKRKTYKQRSTKHTHKTKDRVTRTPVKPGCDLRCSGRVGSSCSTSVTLSYLLTLLFHIVVLYPIIKS